MMKTKTIVAFASLGLLGGACTVANAQHLEEWVSGLDKPVDMVPDPGADNRFYVVEQNSGRVRVVEDGKVLDTPFLALPEDDFQMQGWEQGLLGMALDPDFATNHYLYVNYTGPRTKHRGEPCYTYITRFTATDAHTVDPDSAHVVIRVEQPYGNHNCGNIRFGPDGMLYVGFGDGGAANDPKGAGQDLSNILASIIRIDPRTDAFPDDEYRNYSIPKDNPFVDREGARPEIFLWGIRNPWGMEFDSKGNLWFADVGQNRFEEVNMHPAGPGGQNYGWNTMEGLRAFKPRSTGSVATDPDPVSREEHRSRGFEPPVWDYRHHPEDRPQRMGSITGGMMYEGKNVSAMEGRYICADFMSGRVWTFKLKDGVADDVVEHTSAFASAFKNGAQLAISDFAHDNHNELYVLNHKDGVILKLVD